MIQSGYLIITDISGYTAFLTQAELEHAREILGSLFETMVNHIMPPLVISKLEGDAIFMYTPDASVMQGQTLFEMIEQVYFEFLRARDNINRACQCQACALASTLDLKAVVHYGKFSTQTIAGGVELQGPDVILAHRLLKNEVIENTGVKAYIFITNAASDGLGLGDVIEGLIPHSETYEHLGPVQGYVVDLAEAIERHRASRQIRINPEEAWATVAFDLPVPPARAWDYLNNPQCVCEWCELAEINVTGLDRGRLGVGSGRHCIHASGKTIEVQTILDYQPFDYVTVESIERDSMVIRITTEITPQNGESHIEWRMSKPSGKNGLQGFFIGLMAGMMKGEIIREVTKDSDRLQKLVETEVQHVA